MSQTTADLLLIWRSEFEISEACNYLISNTLGAMPKRMRARMADYADAWNVRGIRAWPDSWWNLQALFIDPGAVGSIAWTNGVEAWIL